MNDLKTILKTALIFALILLLIGFMSAVSLILFVKIYGVAPF